MWGKAGRGGSNASVILSCLSSFSLNWSLGNSLALVCYKTGAHNPGEPLNSSYSETQAAPPPRRPTTEKPRRSSSPKHQVASPPPGTENVFQGHISWIDSERRRLLCSSALDRRFWQRRLGEGKVSRDG